MSPDEARQVIIGEGLGPDGVVVLLRMGDDPGPERMARIIAATRVVFEDLDGAEAVDRQLAYALFSLACYCESEVQSWSRGGRCWRPTLTDMELPALLMAIESVFSGEWADLTTEA